MKEHPMVEICQGRMNQQEMETFFQDHNISVVVDATHPYADIVTNNIKAATEHTNVHYLRLNRETKKQSDYEKLHYVSSHEECVDALEHISGNILLTTGSKDLATYCVNEALKERLFVRVLPGIESLEHCIKNGISGKQILALQGPFSRELNEALIRQYRISCMVTKMSGKNGGYDEKIEAARSLGIPVFVVRKNSDGVRGQKQENPSNENNFQEVCTKLEELCEVSIEPNLHFSIELCGIGMGDQSVMTVEVAEAIHRADIILGAERMIRPYTPTLEKQPLYRAEQIIPYLKELKNRTDIVYSHRNLYVVVLFSGDSGFYSGTQSLFHRLQEEQNAGGIEGTVRILPGISSVSYLASLIGESYHNSQVLSVHGRTVTNLIRKISESSKTFLLTNGAESIRTLGTELCKAGMYECEITIGIQLSYPEQKIFVMSPSECMTFDQKGLITCFIKNPYPESLKACHGIPDSEFIRDKAPMTKEEVREISICKLHLKKDSVVYDIGSGTGSIAMEIASLSDKIQVFAIERKEEAAELIRKNKEKFCLSNISIIHSEAPDGLEELPVPTHAFIGGSGKQMDEILDVLYKKNPSMRIVINAVTLETICEITHILEHYPVENVDLVQVQVTRSRQVGAYHMMQAENPVWICSFDLSQREEI